MAPTRQPRAAASDEDDPIVANYSVFIKPTLPKHRNLVVLQYVNKTAQDPAQIRVPRIAELRMKPKTGMYEVDVPIETTEAYDRNKGVAWGTALQKSMEAKKGGSLGLAGGFNIVATSTSARGRRGAGASADDDTPLNWAEAARQGKVLRTQTFGGGRSAEEENTRHMIGVFQGKNLHLTPVSSVVHLRPVPHHLDAATEQERLARGGGANNAGEKPGASGPGSGGSAGAAGGRAIHMTIKSAMDADGGVATETMADRLRNVQTEAWQRMEWVHDEAEMAWEAYNECLLLRPSSLNGNDGDGNTAETTASATKEGGAGQEAIEDKGKGKEIADAAEAAAGGSTKIDESGAPDLVDKVPRLKTDWGEQELLRASKETAVKVEEQAVEGRAQTGRMGGSAGAASGATGASGARRSTRKGATRGNAMEID
ncbi:Sin-like protein conserved region-domain-containing protein [Corynascus novoguineensis]|uniref:Sin-like protein conserved region-domain-containing protein n=1 Tax=Corynascus novoguineensis TaxID=1126955 RepID=A0AAN7CW45_9PEZI|nr:Sin-like protein conserved region-domain-containing protein [Corynascus novoguineensis]